MVYAEGQYEAAVQKALCRYLKPGSVFYDVGAHIGVVSMFGGQLVGTQGMVFAFEADPANASRIEEHLRRNQFNQIQVVPCAVWSSRGRLKFKCASTQSSRNEGAIAADTATSGEGTIEVEALSLDDFAKEHFPPTLLKIDVEGAEAEILRGSVEVFSRTKPVLICEVHHGQAAEEVAEWLQQRGYTFEWLEDSHQFPCHLLACPKN